MNYSQDTVKIICQKIKIDYKDFERKSLISILFIFGVPTLISLYYILILKY